MTGVFICGIGVVGGFGSGVSALEKALAGDRPQPEMVSIPAREGEIRVPCLLADTGRLAEFMPTRNLRRMSHYIRLGLLAAMDAMADAGILEPDRRGRLGIIVATGHGATGNNYAFQYPFEDREEICGSPTRFANSVHNAAAAYISIALKEMGPNHSITHDDLSFPSALLTAVTWLRQKRVDAVLVGGVDELSHAYAYANHVHNENTIFPPHPVPLPRGRGNVYRLLPSHPDYFQGFRKALPRPLRGEGRGEGLEVSCDCPAPPGEGACFFVLKADGGTRPVYAAIRDMKMGRDRISPFDPPPGACIVGRGGAAAFKADYDPWLGPDSQERIYASVYGDLPVDSAFDLAIGAVSIKQGHAFCG